MPGIKRTGEPIRMQNGRHTHVWKDDLQRGKLDDVFAQPAEDRVGHQHYVCPVTGEAWILTEQWQGQGNQTTMLDASFMGHTHEFPVPWDVEGQMEKNTPL